MPALLYVLALGAFGLITTELGVIGILPQLSQAFGVSIQTAGWLLSGFALTIALAGPAMTLLFSRIDRKTSLCLVLALFVFSNIGSAVAPSFGWLLALRVLPAFLHPVFWSVAMSVAAASVAHERASRAVAIVFAGMSAGIVFGVPLASLAASQAGWSAAFLAFGTLNLVALVAHLLLVPRMPALRYRSLGEQLGVLRKGALWWNLALQVAMTAAVFSIYGYMADYLKEVTGLSAHMIGAMLFLFGLAGVGGTLAAGRLMGFHLTRTLVGFLAAFAPVLLLVFLVGDSPAATIVLVLIWGLVHAAAVPLCQAIVLRAAPEAPEFSNSLFNSFGNIGIASGTTLGGFIIAAFGIADLPLASLALLAIAALIFAVERARYGSLISTAGLRSCG
jgi:MFS transporter, DHA1 family, inner membrane transport protein